MHTAGAQRRLPNPPASSKKVERDRGRHQAGTCQAGHGDVSAAGAPGPRSHGRPSARSLLLPYLRLWERQHLGPGRWSRRLRCPGSRPAGVPASRKRASAWRGGRPGAGGAGRQAVWLGPCVLPPGPRGAAPAVVRPSRCGSPAPGDLRLGGVCVGLFSPCLTTFNFLGKAHKLRLGPIHTET